MTDSTAEYAPPVEIRNLAELKRTVRGAVLSALWSWFLTWVVIGIVGAVVISALNKIP